MSTFRDPATNSRGKRKVRADNVPPPKRKQHERYAQPQEVVRLIEFPGKYEILTPGELAELSDERLVALIAERGGMDESRAREALATIRRGGRGGAYERV